MNFPFSHRQSQTSPSPTAVNHHSLFSVSPGSAAWQGASSQLLINLGGAGCIPGHLTTSSSGGNLGTRRPGTFSYIKPLTTSQPCLWPLQQERTLKTRVKNNSRKPQHSEVTFPKSSTAPTQAGATNLYEVTIHLSFLVCEMGICPPHLPGTQKLRGQLQLGLVKVIPGSSGPRWKHATSMGQDFGRPLHG